MIRSTLGIPLACAALAVAAAAPQTKLRNHFDSDAPMRPPGFFDFVVLGTPGPAEWMVIGDQNPPSAPNQLTQTFAKRPDGSIAAALRRNVTLADGRLSVTIKRGSSPGGLLFRMADDANFLLLLVDQTSQEVRLSGYRAGAAKELARGKIETERDWGILSVDLSGGTARVDWNGKEALRASGLPTTSGRVGLAALGRSSFDEFVIEARSARGDRSAGDRAPGS